MKGRSEKGSRVTSLWKADLKRVQGILGLYIIFHPYKTQESQLKSSCD